MTIRPDPGNPDVAHSYAVGIMERIHRSEPVGDFPTPYMNIIVSGPDLHDTYDPDVLMRSGSAYMYFPGGVPTSDKTLVGLDYGPKDESIDVQSLRQTIIAMSVGDAALARIDPEVTRRRQRYGDMIATMGGTAVTAMLDQCGLNKTPFGVVEIRKVVESEILPIGGRVGVLWYPLVVHPKPVLHNIQNAIRRLTIKGVP